MYRLIAIDLDGTLLTPRPTKIITPRTYQALRQAAEKGITIVIATGQTLSVLRHTWAGLPLNAPQIIENAAIIAYTPKGYITHKKPIPPELILSNLNTLRSSALL